MPTRDEVRSQLTDILVAVVGCSPDQVRDDARLEDLGVDSLAAVEVADELGRRFGIHISDDDANGVVTVSDAITAVTEHRPGGSGARTPVAAAARPERAPRDERGSGGFTARADAFWRLAMWFVVAGLAIGIVLGFGGAAVVKATGIGDVDLPPIVSPTQSSPSPTPSETASPTPSPTETTETTEKPTFTVESDSVSAGQRFSISGRFPDLDDGEVLQVQVRDEGEDWDDFPVSVRTREGGTFETKIYTSRPGKRDFRVLHEESNQASPSATVTIG